MKYLDTRPIDAVQWTGDNLEEIKELVDYVLEGNNGAIVMPLRGTIITILKGQWIVLNAINKIQFILTDEEFQEHFKKYHEPQPPEFGPECYKIGDRVQWTHSYRQGSTLNFTTWEGKVVNIGNLHLVIERRKKKYKVKYQDASPMDAPNPLTKAILES